MPVETAPPAQETPSSGQGKNRLPELNGNGKSKGMLLMETLAPNNPSKYLSMRELCDLVILRDQLSPDIGMFTPSSMSKETRHKITRLHYLLGKISLRSAQQFLTDSNITPEMFRLIKKDIDPDIPVPVKKTTDGMTKTEREDLRNLRRMRIFTSKHSPDEKKEIVRFGDLILKEGIESLAVALKKVGVRNPATYHEYKRELEGVPEDSAETLLQIQELLASVRDPSKARSSIPSGSNGHGEGSPLPSVGGTTSRVHNLLGDAEEKPSPEEQARNGTHPPKTGLTKSKLNDLLGGPAKKATSKKSEPIQLSAEEESEYLELKKMRIPTLEKGCAHSIQTKRKVLRYVDLLKKKGIPISVALHEIGLRNHSNIYAWEIEIMRKGESTPTSVVIDTRNDIGSVVHPLDAHANGNGATAHTVAETAVGSDANADVTQNAAPLFSEPPLLNDSIHADDTVIDVPESTSLPAVETPVELPPHADDNEVITVPLAEAPGPVVLEETPEAAAFDAEIVTAELVSDSPDELAHDSPPIPETSSWAPDVRLVPPPDFSPVVHQNYARRTPPSRSAQEEFQRLEKVLLGKKITSVSQIDPKTMRLIEQYLTLAELNEKEMIEVNRRMVSNGTAVLQRLGIGEHDYLMRKQELLESDDYYEISTPGISGKVLTEQTEEEHLRAFGVDKNRFSRLQQVAHGLRSDAMREFVFKLWNGPLNGKTLGHFPSESRDYVELKGNLFSLTPQFRSDLRSVLMSLYFFGPHQNHQFPEENFADLKPFAKKLGLPWNETDPEERGALNAQGELEAA